MTNSTCSKPRNKAAFIGYLAAYVASILGMAASRSSLEGSLMLWIACLIPPAFAFLAMREVYYGVMQMDEMIRRIHMEAFMIGAGLTAMITFTWGLLENAGLPAFEITLVFPMMILLYGFATMLRKRAYA